MRELNWAFMGRQPYPQMVELQEQLRVDLRGGDGGEHLLLLEHPPVFTLGRNADPSDVVASGQWLAQRKVEIHETNRGGKVTYHGPGQLVGYPIIDLDPDRRDIRRYVRDLQEVLVQSLATFGIEAEPRHEQALIGVWVDDAKIASIGVHLSRWITTHGFALNVATDLDYFDGIVACGIDGVRMVSMEAVLGRRPCLREVAKVVARSFGETFERRLTEIETLPVVVTRD